MKSPFFSANPHSFHRENSDLILPDKFHDECAVFGIYGHKEAANLTYLGPVSYTHLTLPTILLV